MALLVNLRIFFENLFLMKPLKYFKILKDPFCIENKLCLLHYDFMVFESDYCSDF